MADTFVSQHAVRPGIRISDAVKGLIKSFAWAMEMRRRCDREIAAGRQLDGDTIRRIADELTAEKSFLN
jgi:hypothetical protein